ncbi:MAG: hypothetical protein JXR84_04125 [Anaerolineae bacterium]|nr:hypothetical protein [Anaerolineae bacterium]
MATLTLAIATLTASKTVDNTKATNVLLNVSMLYNPNHSSQTNQQRLDWIIETLIPQTLTQMSLRYEEQQAALDAAEAFEIGDSKFE